MDDPTQEVRAAIAANENIAAICIVSGLDADPSPLVRASIARREDMPRAVLQAAANDPNPLVRESVAMNSRAGRALTNAQLWALAADLHVPTRLALGKLPDLPPKVVLHLADDESSDVRMTVARHHATRIPLRPLLLAQFVGLMGPDDAIKAWALPPRSDWTRIVAYAQPGAPIVALIAILTRGDLVNTLLGSDNPSVRAAVLFNVRVRDYQRQAAVENDPDESVKAAALRSQQLRTSARFYA